MTMHSRKFIRLLASTALALVALAGTSDLVSGGAVAQQVTNAASGSVVQLPVSQGQLIRLDRPITSVFIADTEIADVGIKSQQLIYVFAKRPGTTTIYATDENDNVLASVTLVVTHNVGQLNQVIAQAMPGRNIQVQSVSGGIILSGSVPSALEAEDARRLAARFLGPDEEIINRLQVTMPNQVNLRVRIAEINRNTLKNLGINWAAVAGNADALFGIATALPVNPLGVASSLTGTGTVLTKNFDLTATIDLLNQQGLATVLAEPNLTAISGETASFVAGGEIPIPRGAAGRWQHHDRTASVRRDARLYANRAGRQSHQHARAARGQRSIVRQLDHDRHDYISWLHCPACRNHGRARQRPIACHRRSGPRRPSA